MTSYGRESQSGSDKQEKQKGKSIKQSTTEIILHILSALLASVIKTRCLEGGGAVLQEQHKFWMLGGNDPNRVLSSNSKDIATSDRKASLVSSVSRTNVLEFNTSSTFNSALIVQGRYKAVKIGSSSASAWNKKGARDTLLETGDNTCMEISVLVDLCTRLQNMWRDLTLTGAVLTTAAITQLKEIASIAMHIGDIFKSQPIPQFTSLVRFMFSMFPYISSEASVAVPGSVVDIEGRKNVDILNISLCDLVLVLGNSSEVTTNTTSSFASSSSCERGEKDEFDRERFSNLSHV